MPRIFNAQTIKILELLHKTPGLSGPELYKPFEKLTSYKDFYNNLYRLEKLELLSKKSSSDGKAYYITEEGIQALARANPTRDGIWKLVIFDIPEKQKYVRTVLRAKLKSLHFKKWQNSIWVSPYALDEEIEAEMKALAKKFFVRLIKTKDINETEDLEKLFD